MAEIIVKLSKEELIALTNKLKEAPAVPVQELSDFQIKLQDAAERLNSGLATFNEIRKEFGLEPKSDGDIRVVKADQPSTDQ